MAKTRKAQKWNETDLNEIPSYEMPATYTETKHCYETTDYKINFKAKNEKQKELYRMIHEKEIVFVQGSAGSGKSYTGLSAALNLLKGDNPYRQIVLIAQTVQSELELGFLKGSIDDKILPFLAPAFYNIEKILRESGNRRNPKDILSELRKCEFIVYNHISFLRGVNIDNSIVVIDEAQQYSKSAMKTMLTRIGNNSKYIFMSDIEQCDNKELKKNKDMIGIYYAMNKLKDIENVGIVEFNNDEIVRNPIIGKILDVWE
jgi:phosphate starvation-inducible PhoH-like protein